MKKIIYKLIIIILGLFAVISGLITADKKIDIETLYYFTYQSNILVIVYFIIYIIYLGLTQITKKAPFLLNYI